MVKKSLGLLLMKIGSFFSFLFCEIIKVRPHYAARQNATIRSFAAWQKLLGICRQCDCIHMKKIFCRPSSGYKNCRTRPVNLDFFLKLADTILRPLRCTASFDGTDNLPIEFLGCAASNGMPQLS